MPNEKRNTANRKNSARSTGPRTPEGKAICAANPIKHGLRSARVVIAGESWDEFDASVDRLVEQHSPVGDTETALVREMASCHWRLQRARGFEATLFERLYNDPATKNPVDAFSDSQKELDNLRRYMTSTERAWYKAINTLRMLQKDRATAEKAAVKSAEAEARLAQPEPKTLEQLMEEYLSRPIGTDDSDDEAELTVDDSAWQNGSARQNAQKTSESDLDEEDEDSETAEDEAGETAEDSAVVAEFLENLAEVEAMAKRYGMKPAPSEPESPATGN